MIRAVVFDFDGVLADTERLHLQAFQQVFHARGWTLGEAAYFDRYLGYDDEGLVCAFDSDENLGLSADRQAALVSEKGRVFAEYLDTREVLFPGARACVELLGGRYLLGIASGALKAEIQRILASAGLLERFPVIVSAEDVSACKPAPDPYLQAARLLGVQPEACLAIEDSPQGLKSARSAGMRTIGVATTTAPDQLRADRVIGGLDELTLDVLQDLGL